MEKKAFVIGCGRWGSFIAWYLNHININTTLYGRENSKNFNMLKSTRSNSYLKLDDNIKLTSSLNDSKLYDYIFISISSQNLQNLMNELSAINLSDKTIILCMKGIEIQTGKRLSQIASDTLNKSNKVAVWLGPGHVQSFISGIPNCMVIDSNDEKVKYELVDLLSSKLIRLYYGCDLIGNEIGGAAKNVIGIAAGMLDGLKLTSLKGPLMARGPKEISTLIETLGGNPISAYGLCHLGDYEATLFSKNSHNREFGERFVLNESFDSLAEGYYTIKALHNISIKYNLPLPISNALYDILFDKKNVKDTIYKLFDRSIKREF
ncbi:MAG: 2-dehydropantoate 2-reductase N-terminal domain-containing protein [Eubacteriales bacterium]|nr:2-dehydropantoate 2-reductase N-terminal domain-containing protein [Eubacteriales bacterium]